MEKVAKAMIDWKGRASPRDDMFFVEKRVVAADIDLREHEVPAVGFDTLEDERPATFAQAYPICHATRPRLHGFSTKHAP